MKWFKIDGREWKVRIFEPEEAFTILYSENTGRTLGVGSPMVLDPLGTFFNYTMIVGRKRGEKNDFDELFDYLSVPRTEPLLIVFPRSGRRWTSENEDGETIEGFYAYVSNGKRKIRKVIEDENGDAKEVEYDSFSVNFIAQKAQVLPDVENE